jgi:hypothetical protein
MTENETIQNVPTNGAEIRGTVKTCDVDIVIRGADGQIRERRTQVQKED